jgi:hypothetical protein
VPLTGSTITDGAIQSYVGPLGGTTLPANSTTTYAFRIRLNSNLPVSRTKPLLAFETYLDQINPADGTGTTSPTQPNTSSRCPPCSHHHRTRCATS